MKRIFSVLLAALFVLALPSVLAEGQPAGFAVPEVYRTVSARLDRDTLPQDLPAEAAVITAASFSASSLTVELSGPVPSLSVSQYDDEGDLVVLASAENASSLSADGVDASQGMADVVLSWELEGGNLSATWSVWTDGTFDFIQCQYTSEAEGEQFAPYTTEERVIELSQQMVVVSDVRTLSNDMDSFALTLDYSESGDLEDYQCEWSLGEDGTWFLIRTAADRIPAAVSYHSGSTDFDAVSDPVISYLGGVSQVMETLEYDAAFTALVKRQYPQLPEPDFYKPSTPTDLSIPGAEGSLWVLLSGADEDSLWFPFVTADSLFLIKDGAVVLNTEARDINGAAPEFSGLALELPAFELPEIR